MKSLWKKFIDLLMPKTRNEGTYASENKLEKHFILDKDEKIINLRKSEMQQFIAQKKKRKPFYKEDNKKDWE